MGDRKIYITLTLILIFGILASCWSLPADAVLPADAEKSPLGGDQTITSLTIEAPLTPSSLPPPTTQTRAPASPTPSPMPDLPCTPDYCSYWGHFWMSRPILPTDYDHVDSSYRYGSTQEGARPTHHGVEFVNPEGTPVLAAADGLVIVAGSDSQQAYADFPFYYGNLVILEHHFPGLDLPVYSLYGHLSAVQTQVGDYVQAGSQIGAVGYTGVAEWSHLHFEVRVGENTYRHTRNPELWLAPHADENGVLHGGIAGRIVDEFGSSIYIPNVVIEKLGPASEVTETIYVETYADFSVNGDDQWGENFAVGDLSAGLYRVSFVARGLQTWEVTVLPGALTLITFDARVP